MKPPLIVWDPGHGEHDSGAVSPTGLKESDVVLAICLAAVSFLAPYPVVNRLTRTQDVFIELGTRASFANGLDADLFVSVHCNSATNPASGFEVFTSPGQTDSDEAATEIFEEYLATPRFKGMKARAEYGDGDPDKEAKFIVLTRTNMAAVLVETEFIHTPEGDRFFRDQANIQAAGQALGRGVLRACGIPVNAPTPILPGQPSGIQGIVACAHNEQVIKLAEQIIALHNK